MLEKLKAFLKALAESELFAVVVAQFLEKLLPGTGLGTVKKELGLSLIKAARENADPDSVAIDLAVARLNATKGWDEPTVGA